MPDAAMRERAADLRDVGRQLIAALMARESSKFTSDGRDYLFAADEFLPSDAGILEPSGDRPAVESAEDWEFHVSSVRRVRTVVHLQRDLGVNLAGAALALELLDQIAALKARR